MAKIYYGSLVNRLGENNSLCDEIKVGDGMTEYSYSDRRAYEVVKVANQNHVFVREFDHIPVGKPMSNEWELVSNSNNPIKELKKRYGHWNWVYEVTTESIKNAYLIDEKLYNKVMENGSATAYRKANISFGTAQYYYDYEF